MMSIAAYFQVGNRLQIVNFSQIAPKIPIITKTGRVIYVRWGRRLNEPGVLPIGGWTSQESIEQSIWQQYQPELVKLGNLQLIDIHYGQDHISANIQAAQPIAGLFIQRGKEKRVYLVTVKSPAYDMFAYKVKQYQ